MMIAKIYKKLSYKKKEENLMNHKINDDKRWLIEYTTKGINFRWFGPSAYNLSFEFFNSSSHIRFRIILWDLRIEHADREILR